PIVLPGDEGSARAVRGDSRGRIADESRRDRDSGCTPLRYAAEIQTLGADAVRAEIPPCSNEATRSIGRAFGPLSGETRMIELYSSWSPERRAGSTQALCEHVIVAPKDDRAPVTFRNHGRWVVAALA